MFLETVEDFMELEVLLIQFIGEFVGFLHFPYFLADFHSNYLVFSSIKDCFLDHLCNFSSISKHFPHLLADFQSNYLVFSSTKDCFLDHICNFSSISKHFPYLLADFHSNYLVFTSIKDCLILQIGLYILNLISIHCLLSKLHLC